MKVNFLMILTSHKVNFFHYVLNDFLHRRRLSGYFGRLCCLGKPRVGITSQISLAKLQRKIFDLFSIDVNSFFLWTHSLLFDIILSKIKVNILCSAALLIISRKGLSLPCISTTHFQIPQKEASRSSSVAMVTVIDDDDDVTHLGFLTYEKCLMS